MTFGSSYREVRKIEGWRNLDSKVLMYFTIESVISYQLVIRMFFKK